MLLLHKNAWEKISIFEVSNRDLRLASVFGITR
jgi:hypothetical protein